MLNPVPSVLMLLLTDVPPGGCGPDQLLTANGPTEKGGDKGNPWLILFEITCFLGILTELLAQFMEVDCPMEAQLNGGKHIFKKIVQNISLP
jgi:hypothetical protein